MANLDDLYSKAFGVAPKSQSPDLVQSIGNIFNSPMVQAVAQPLIKTFESAYAGNVDPITQITDPKLAQQVKQSAAQKFPNLYTKQGDTKINMDTVTNAIKSLGITNTPGTVIGAGLINPIFQGGVNMLQGKSPFDQNLQQSVAQGEDFGALLGPLAKVAEPILNPLTSKLGTSALGKITGAGINAAVPMAGVGALEPADSLRQRAVNALGLGAQGFIFGAGTKGLGLALNKAKIAYPGSIFADEHGYIRIPGLANATEEEYRTGIKDKIKQAIITQASDPVTKEQMGPDMYRLNQQMSKEFLKNPDKFIDKYQLLPPEITGKTAPAPGQIAGVNPEEAALVNANASTPDLEQGRTPQEIINEESQKSAADAKTKAEADLITLSHDMNAKSKGIIPDTSSDSKAIVQEWMKGVKQDFAMGEKVLNDIRDKIARGAKLTDDELNQAGNWLKKIYLGKFGGLTQDGTAMADMLKPYLPDKLSQEALSLFIEFRNSPGKLITLAQKMASEEDYKPYLPIYNRMIELMDAKDPNFIKAADAVQQWFQMRGENAVKKGYLDQLLPDYVTHIVSKGGDTKEARDYKGLASTVRTSTPYAMERTQQDFMQLIDSGNKPETLNILDIVKNYAEKDARAWAGNDLIQRLEATGLGKYVEAGTKDEWAGGKVPLDEVTRALTKISDWIGKDDEGNPIAGHTESELKVYPQIAKMLAPIVDPNMVMKIGPIKNIRVSQALLKGVELSLSPFHVKQLHIVGLNSMGGKELVRADLMVKAADQTFATPEFIDNEHDFASHTGLTSAVGGEARSISRPRVSNIKFLDNPLTRAFDDTATKITDFTFGKIQRVYKVHDYSLRVSKYILQHPDTTPEALDAEKFKIAKQVNDLYGGMNWEDMGFDKNAQSLLRMFLLAPDWTFSNLMLPVHGLTGQTPMGSSFTFYARSLLTGLALTQIANIFLNGGKPQYDKNNPTSLFQVKIPHQDGTYAYANAFFAGDVKDWVTLADDIRQKGPIGGTMTFIYGKAAPAYQTAIEFAKQQDYYGNPIAPTGKGWLPNTLSEAGLLSGGIPTPFMASMPTQLYSSSGGSASPLEYLLSSTGMATITEHTPRKDAIAKVEPVYYKMHPTATEAQAYAWASRKVGGKNKKAPNIINDVLTDIKNFEGKTPENTPQSTSVLDSLYSNVFGGGTSASNPDLDALYKKAFPNQ